MKKCSKCKSVIEDEVKFCPYCGWDTEKKAEENSDFSKKIHDLNNTEDTTSSYEEKDIQENKGISVLCYLSWLVLIPIFARKESRFARYHTNQGIILAIIETIWWVIQGTIVALCSLINPKVGYIASLILGLANTVFIPFIIIGIINVANGKAKELPIIGKFKIIK